MIASIVTAFYVAGILAAVHAVMTTRTAPGAIAWSVSLVAMPFLAVPAYLVLGRSKFEGMVEAYEDRKDEIDAALAEFKKNQEPWIVSGDGAYAEYAAIRNLVSTEITRGNRAELLINGDATFDSILTGVGQAQEYVLFQFYMFHDDGLGRRVQQALIERAKAGVRVYVLYDEIGSGGLPARYMDELRSAGAEAVSYTHLTLPTTPYV